MKRKFEIVQEFKNKKRKNPNSINLPNETLDMVFEYCDTAGLLKLRLCSKLMLEKANPLVKNICFKSDQERNLRTIIRNFQNLEKIIIEKKNIYIDRQFYEENERKLKKINYIEQHNLELYDFYFFALKKIYMNVKNEDDYFEIFYNNFKLLSRNKQTRQDTIDNLNYLDVNLLEVIICEIMQKSKKNSKEIILMDNLLEIPEITSKFINSCKMKNLFYKLIEEEKATELYYMANFGFHTKSMIKKEQHILLFGFLKEFKFKIANFIIGHCDKNELYSSKLFNYFFANAILKKRYHILDFFIKNDYDIHKFILYELSAAQIFISFLKEGDYKQIDYLFGKGFGNIINNQYFYEIIKAELILTNEDLLIDLFELKKLKLNTRINQKPFIDILPIIIKQQNQDFINILADYGFDIKKHMNSIFAIDNYELILTKLLLFAGSDVEKYQKRIEFMINNGFEYKKLSNSYFIDKITNSYHFKQTDYEKVFGFIEYLNKTF